MPKGWRRLAVAVPRRTEHAHHADALFRRIATTSIVLFAASLARPQNRFTQLWQAQTQRLPESSALFVAVKSIASA